MKAVWRAVDTNTGEPVAVAIYKDQHDDLSFQCEVELAQRVQSRYVARVLGGGVEPSEGVAYVVSELCEGKDLGRLIREPDRLSRNMALELGYRLALGLQAIHAAHVLHRDIKPKNAMVTPDGPKWIDFGISLRAVDAVTATGISLPSVAGTAAYMAPEVIHCDVDARTDVYALGISFFEMFTGRPPLLASNFLEQIARLQALAAHEIEPLRDQPKELVELIGCMIDMQRDNRPFMPEVVERLRSIAGDQNSIAPA